MHSSKFVYRTQTNTMEVKCYNFPSQLNEDLQEKVLVRHSHCKELSLIYVEDDTDESRLLLRNLLSNMPRPIVLLSSSKEFFKVGWQLEIDHFIHQNEQGEFDFGKINRGLKLALHRNDFYLNRIAFRFQENLNSVQVKEIAYIEADGSYAKVITNTKEILVSKKLKYFEDLLCELPNFHRFGRSLILNINKIQSLEGRDVVLEDGLTVSFPKSGNSFKQLKEILLWKNT